MELNLNKNIETIINVYMQNYTNAPGGGIGDFFRGSFFLLQFCIKNNLCFDVDYQNHPISKYLYKKYDRINEKINYNNVLYYYPDNVKTTMNFYNDFISYIYSIENKHIYMFSNNYPLYSISKLEKNFLKDKFLPNDELNTSINNKLILFQLTEKKFNIIHIRIDDSVFKNDNVNYNINFKLFYFINKIAKNSSSKILLLSNSNTVKTNIKNKYPNIITELNNITHLAHASNDLSIKDTLTDMFLMTKANNVFAISSYGHGTGFSKYICEIYDISYFPFLL